MIGLAQYIYYPAHERLRAITIGEAGRDEIRYVVAELPPDIVNKLKDIEFYLINGDEKTMAETKLKNQAVADLECLLEMSQNLTKYPESPLYRWAEMMGLTIRILGPVSHLARGARYLLDANKKKVFAEMVKAKDDDLIMDTGLTKRELSLVMLTSQSLQMLFGAEVPTELVGAPEGTITPPETGTTHEQVFFGKLLLPSEQQSPLLGEEEM